MPIKVCPKCGKEFNDTANYNRHMKRKTPCALILDKEDLPEEEKESLHQCRFCGRTFSTGSNLMRHMKKACKVALHDGNTTGMEKPHEHTLREQVERQQKEMETLKAQVSALTVAVSGGEQAIAPAWSSRAVVQNRLALRTQERAPGTFGEEGSTVLDAESIASIETGVTPFVTTETGDRKQLVQVLTRAALCVYSAPQNAATLTCFLPNKKGDEALIKGPAGWEIWPLTLVMSTMVSCTLDAVRGRQENFKEANLWICKALEDARDDLIHILPSGEFRALLIRNRSLLEQALGKVPQPGEQ